MVEFFIAWRHVVERKFQSIFSILGVGIAVTVFVVSLTISNGLNKNMINTLLTMSPHILVKSRKDAFFENYNSVIDSTKGIKEVTAVIPQINSQSILKYKGFAKGVLAKGMTAENVKKDLKLRILNGNNNISELNSVLIGEELSKEMNAKVGQEISLVSAENKEVKLIVRGIFKTGFLDYDSNLVVVPLKTMQIMSERGEVATEVGIITANPQKVDKVFEESYVIKNENSAENMGSGDLAVLSTPSLVAFMENAAKNYLNKFLPEEMGSVGSNININHIAPTLIGNSITVRGKITEVIKEKIIKFSIEAYEKDKKIGDAEHTRVIINNTKFLEKLNN